MKPGVAERKWEIDSLCYPIRLAHGYWRQTGDVAPFDDEWRMAMRLAVATFRAQQRKNDPGPYRFQRPTIAATETQFGDGYGNPTRKIGLIHAAFRPSDDACLYPFFIPGNLFAVRSLRQLAEMAATIHHDVGFATECAALADEVNAALIAHGRLRDETGRDIWAYEVDGFGNGLFMDDANAPSLLALPYLGCCDRRDPLYLRTRAQLWSPRNPWFFSGRAAEGIGGPHEGLRMIWPMSLILYALTSDNDGEIRRCLAWLKSSHDHTGFIHEAFDQDDPAHYTRPWFAWANTLFGELILDLYARKPALLRGPII
jgi:meiotically up-regulated gene 157 (Mug157) protein